MVRDVFSQGFGGEAESKDASLLFKILHCEEPVKLLAEAAPVVRPGGVVLVIEWRFDPFGGCESSPGRAQELPGGHRGDGLEPNGDSNT